MKKLCLFLIVFSCVLLLCGCDNKKKSLIGTWKSDEYTYIFNEDKSCSYIMDLRELKCTYEIKGRNLLITFDGNTDIFKTTYRIKNNVLSIKDSSGTNTDYIRSK